MHLSSIFIFSERKNPHIVALFVYNLSVITLLLLLLRLPIHQYRFLIKIYFFFFFNSKKINRLTMGNAFNKVPHILQYVYVQAEICRQHFYESRGWVTGIILPPKWGVGFTFFSKRRKHQVFKIAQDLTGTRLFSIYTAEYNYYYTDLVNTCIISKFDYYSFV